MLLKIEIVPNNETDDSDYWIKEQTIYAKVEAICETKNSIEYVLSVAPIWIDESFDYPYHAVLSCYLNDENTTLIVSYSDPAVTLEVPAKVAIVSEFPLSLHLSKVEL